LGRREVKRMLSEGFVFDKVKSALRNEAVAIGGRLTDQGFLKGMSRAIYEVLTSSDFKDYIIQQIKDKV
jgi:hypothetical protein